MYFIKKQPITFKAIQTTEHNPPGHLFVPHSAASDYHTRQTGIYMYALFQADFPSLPVANVFWQNGCPFD